MAAWNNYCARSFGPHLLGIERKNVGPQFLFISYKSVMESNELVLSPLGHTWILDLDGTIVKHNGYKIDGKDSFLSGAKEFLSSIPEGDFVVIITSRTEEYRELTLDFLNNNSVRFNHIIFNAPYGERILMNDDKPSGLQCAIAISSNRDSFKYPGVIINQNR